jgi:RNA polymerase sigma-70 factor (ECF subfamily)
VAERSPREHEDRLARAAGQGDRAAAEELLGLLYDHVFAVSVRICVNRADAEDATQNALVAIVRGLPSFDGRSAVRSWAHRVTANAALDEVRRRGRRAVPTDDGANVTDAAVGGAAPALDERTADRLDLDDALRRLPVEFRAPVVLRDVVGMDYAEIAETLDLPPGTVRSRIARGRRQLAESLGLGNRTATPSVSSDEP